MRIEDPRRPHAPLPRPNAQPRRHRSPVGACRDPTDASARIVKPEIHQANPAHGPALRRVALPAAIAPDRRRRSLSAGLFFGTLFPVISLSFPWGTGMIAARRDPRDDLRFRRLLARY